MNKIKSHKDHRRNFNNPQRRLKSVASCLVPPCLTEDMSQIISKTKRRQIAVWQVKSPWIFIKEHYFMSYVLTSKMQALPTLERKEKTDTWWKMAVFQLIMLWHVWTFPTWFTCCKTSGRTWCRRWAVPWATGNKSRGEDKERSRSMGGGKKWCWCLLLTFTHFQFPPPFGHSAVYIWACSPCGFCETHRVQILASTCEHWDVQNQVYQHAQINRTDLLKWSSMDIECCKLLQTVLK